jgi:hypothetical protein
VSAKSSVEPQRESLLVKLRKLCAEREKTDGIKYYPQFECTDISPVELKPHEKIFKYVLKFLCNCDCIVSFRCTLTMAEQGKVFKEEGKNKKMLQQAVIKAVGITFISM